MIRNETERNGGIETEGKGVVRNGREINETVRYSVKRNETVWYARERNETIRQVKRLS